MTNLGNNMCAVYLNKNECWKFTKQETNFDQVFNATRLFNAYLKRPQGKLEDFFERMHYDFGVETDRHRILIISQMLGLITKSEHYRRGSTYDSESVTEVFEIMSRLEMGSYEYNSLKTEQLLKFKIKSITDSTISHDFEVYPIIKIFLVLYDLLEKYNKNEVPLEFIYSYILTSDGFDDIDVLSRILSEKTLDAHRLHSQFKDESRVLTLIKENLNLFIFSDNTVSINPLFKNYFIESIRHKMPIDSIKPYLTNSETYGVFLYKLQNFEINLIDNPNRLSAQDTNAAGMSYSDALDDEDFGTFVQEIDDAKYSEYQVLNNHNSQPNYLDVHQCKVQKNAAVAAHVLKLANYKCEIDEAHHTFKSAKRKNQYTEPHHIIPLSLSKKAWEELGVNLDCIENQISLCPNCHKAVHLASSTEKELILRDIFKKRGEALSRIGINIGIDELLIIYGIK